MESYGVRPPKLGHPPVTLSIEHLCFPVPMQDREGNWHDGRENFAQVGLDVWCRTFHEAPLPGNEVTVVKASGESEQWLIETTHFSVINLVRP